MNTRIFILAILLIPAFAMGQSLNINNSGAIKTQTDFVNNSKGLVQVLDSIYYFEYVGGMWKNIGKRCIQSRHWGTNGLPNEWYSYAYNQATGEWNNYTYEHYTFLSDTAEIIDTYTQKPYNSFTMNWEADTAAYFDYTGYYSRQFEEEVYENTLISRGYDFNTNNFNGGMRYKFHLIDDTLYDVVEMNNFNTSTYSWDKAAKYSYFYDSNGFGQKRLNQTWSSSDNCYVNSEQVFTSWQNGDNIQKVTQYWNGSTWDNNEKQYYEYDANHHVTLYDKSLWDGVNDEWLYDYEYTYVYSGSLLSVRTYLDWNTISNAFVNHTRYTYTYDSNENIITLLRQSWSGSAWVNAYRTTYTYNSADLRTLTLEESWDSGTSTWKNNQREVNTFDSNNNKTQYLLQYWDNGTSSWRNGVKDDYVFDSNNNKTQYIYSTWNIPSAAWDYISKTDYYYSAFDATSLTELFNNKLSVFPNPTNGEITIDSREINANRITIFDMNGRVVYDESNPVSGRTINLRSYGTGLYNISVTDETGEIRTSKVVVQ
ncbi:MAG: hypothetical protein CVU11_03835 [Bacteroidetes bacterium HGW-Bacteroidetes-6]|jgi:hypothetical protein|nr:MAG: hypothetical protein CVU11_03835 [Bacteroidetes bacterium HGW-Bacteroidetes-6]